MAAGGPLPAGEHQIRFEFHYPEPGLGLGGDVGLYLDGEQLASGHVERTQAIAFGFDATGNVGIGEGAPVSDRYPADTRFNGEIRWVRLDSGENDGNHLITDEQMFRAAMTPAMTLIELPHSPSRWGPRTPGPIRRIMRARSTPWSWRRSRSSR